MQEHVHDEKYAIKPNLHNFVLNTIFRKIYFGENTEKLYTKKLSAYHNKK